MSAEPNELQSLHHDIETLRDAFDSVLMATADAHGLPEASYAAYLEEGGDYHVFLSELSTHTGNLMQNGRASLLFIESESEAAHLFARRRLTLQCEAAEIPRGPEFERLLDAMAARFGKLIATLRELQDFHLFRLRPVRGAYVAGFARAYVMDDATLQSLRHVRDKGHRSADGNKAELDPSQIDSDTQST
jgi:heme iron utilization protein